MKKINEYITLGGSGLRISRLSLGTMTFGMPNGLGSDEIEAKSIFNEYLNMGGNFIDTANVYSQGVSEIFLGKFMQEANNRESIVLATKYSAATNNLDPNSGGNGRKNMIRSVEESLKRLETDYIDLFWMHHYDGVTPVEEIIYSLNNLVESGKVRYIGLSDTPAWACSRAQTIAEIRGLEKLCAIQIPYNPLNRNIESEYARLAQELNMGICVWGALASGLLSGKQTKDKLTGRLEKLDKSTGLAHGLRKEHAWDVVEKINDIASKINATSSQVTIAWLLQKQGVSSVIIGARTLEQLKSNMETHFIELSDEHMKEIDEVSKLPLEEPYNSFFTPESYDKRMKEIKVTTSPKTFRK